MTNLIRGLLVLLGLSFGFAAFAQTAAQKIKMKDCLLEDDMVKERLDCFDAIIKPEPDAVKAKKKARSARDCRYLKEEDERLICFNKFTEAKAKAPAKKKAAPKAVPAPK
ncbi:MAG TPA: hypothetical protein VHD34_02890 [Xanthobacteraceae bacterium]|nr:hypothetical protein [Xanthobacteraceae bacterium]